MSEPALDSPHPNKCTATTSKGTRCKAWAVEGSHLCRGHSMSEEEKTALREAAYRAKRERRETRENAKEAAALGLRALLGQRLEARADRITSRMEALALSEDDSTALRGLELWMSRVYGKAVQPTQDVSTELPADVEALRAMSPEDRRALLRSMPPLS